MSAPPGFAPRRDGEITALLDRLGLQRYENLLNDQEIDLEALKLLSYMDFLEIGVDPASASALLDATRRELDAFGADDAPPGPRFALVETAGGVASPGPSGALQCDVLAPLRLPALLVADGRLGGISASICAAEARGAEARTARVHGRHPAPPGCPRAQF